MSKIDADVIYFDLLALNLLHGSHLTERSSSTSPIHHSTFNIHNFV
jgi:hypothetical protein